MSSNKKILVTGGTGLVGSQLLFDLISSGREVRALRRSTSKQEITKRIFKWNSPEKAEDLFSKIEWVEGDILDLYSIEDALENIVEVYHCAGIVSFHKGDFNRILKINIEGTENIVNQILVKNEARLCFVSSTAALGRTDDGKMMDEKSNWKHSKHNSGYAISKYCAEKEVWRGIEEGLSAVIVNPSVIIGPGDWRSGSASMISKGKKGMRYYTPGVNGFVDVRDVSKIMIGLMEKKIQAQRYIISSENKLYREIFDQVADHFHKPHASIAVSRGLSNFVVKLDTLKSFISGTKSLLTKETVNSAFQKNEYSNTKVISELGIKFIPVNESITDSCKALESKI